MKKYVLAMLAALALTAPVAFSQTLTESTVVSLYRGTSKVSDQPSWEACRARAIQLAQASTATSGTVTYSCKTEVRKVVARYAPPPPPTPINCTVSDWVLDSTTWSTSCNNGIQDGVQLWRRTVTTPASNGGTCTDPLTEARPTTRPCTVVPPPVLPHCSDTLDNDQDGLTDLADPGCTSPLDNDETNVSVPPAVDLSEYRVNTYGPPDHYADPTRSLSSAGAGTLTDPWNWNQAMTLSVCGDVTAFLPNGSGASVRLPVAGLDYQAAAFRARVSCPETNPLVFVTRFPAITMVNLTTPSLSNIGANPNRTEIRTDGTPEANGVQGTGRAAYGCTDSNWITFDGFYVDLAQAGINGDQGVITSRWDSGAVQTGCVFKNFAIQGRPTRMDSNPVLWRPNRTIRNVLSNFAAWGHTNPQEGGGLNQRGLFSDQYGDGASLMEQFLLADMDNGAFYKGTANGDFNYGTIKNGIIRNVAQCLRFNDFHPSQLTTLQNILCTGWTQSGLTLGTETSNPRNLLVKNVTIAGGLCTSGCSGGIYIRDHATSDGNITFRDSIIDFTGGNGHGIDAGEFSGAFPTTNFLGYWRGGLGLTWSYRGTQSNSLSAWRTLTGQEANSQVFTSDPFANRTTFTLNPSHPAMTGSSTGGQLGAYGNLTGILGPIVR